MTTPSLSTRPFHPRWLYALLLALIVLVLAASCRPNQDPVGEMDAPTTELTVFAAASLTESFTEIAQAFEEANPGVRVVLNLAGSQQLAVQLEEGAQADVFASANPDKMATVVAAGRIDAVAPAIFCRNQLVIITPADNPDHVNGVADLARPGLKLVLAGEQVPVGNYARQMLDRVAADPAYGADFLSSVLSNVVSNEETVKLVVAKVQLGEADAGVVYNSDVTPGVAADLQRIEIPAEFNVIAEYPVAVLNDARSPELAARFVSYLLGPDGQEILTHWGFAPLQP